MYYLIFVIFFLLSLLPFWLLYLLADVIYFVLYYIIGYRKEVIFSHLKQAFSNKTEAERKVIAKKYMKNLADEMVETIKMMSISKKQLRKRFVFDASIFNYLAKNNRSAQVHMGHVFNWEWANLYISQAIEQPLLTIYKPIKSQAMNRLFGYMRKRFGSHLIAANNLLEEMRPYQGETYISVLVADQYPRGGRAYWFPFLNKMTNFFKGPEISARRGNHAVVFGNIKKVKRGHYKIEIKLVFEYARETKETEITEAFAAYLEKKIREQPENWLWSHRRWKREWKGETNH